MKTTSSDPIQREIQTLALGCVILGDDPSEMDALEAAYEDTVSMQGMLDTLELLDQAFDRARAAYPSAKGSLDEIEKKIYHQMMSL